MKIGGSNRILKANKARDKRYFTVALAHYFLFHHVQPKELIPRILVSRFDFRVIIHFLLRNGQ